MSPAIELTPKVVERFWAKIDRRGPDECWEWTGERHAFGYGFYSEWTGGRTRFLAHRLSLLIAGVDIAGVCVRHNCDNPPCVNPSHLQAGTQADNIRDAVERDRLNTSGLAIGQSVVWPPRPCRRCGITVTAGRQRYCPPCRRISTREIQNRSQRRIRAEKKAAGGMSPRERRRLKKQRRAS